MNTTHIDTFKNKIQLIPQILWLSRHVTAKTLSCLIIMGGTVNFTQMDLNTQMIVKMECIGLIICSIEIHLEPVHTQIKKKLIMKFIVVKGNGILMDNSKEA